MPFDEDDTDKVWMLSPPDHAIVMSKNSGNRLGFAVLLLFYRAYGRFPKRTMEINAEAVARVARQLGIEPDAHDGYDTTGRTWKRHRAEIRTLLGFREATVADALLLEAWLQEQLLAVGVSPEQLVVRLETRCRELSIEPPAADRVARIVRSAIHAHDERFYAGILVRLGQATQDRGSAHETEKIVR